MKKKRQKYWPVWITAVFALISFILWYISTPDHGLSDLWLNLLAGFIAALCTSLGIDQILRKQKEADERPLRLALYRDVQLFASRMIFLWKEMYAQSNEDRESIAIDKLFSEEIISKIYIQLDLEGRPNVIPEQDWFTYINSVAADLVQRGNRILDRYVFIIEPELVFAIHHLITDSPFVSKLLNIRDIRARDAEKRFPRHPLLRRYTPQPRENDYKAMHDLFTWCRTNYEKLAQGERLPKIVESVIIINPNIPPSSIMTREKLNWISSEIELWRSNFTI